MKPIRCKENPTETTGLYLGLIRIISLIAIWSLHLNTRLTVILVHSSVIKGCAYISPVSTKCIFFAGFVIFLYKSCEVQHWNCSASSEAFFPHCTQDVFSWKCLNFWNTTKLIIYSFPLVVSLSTTKQNQDWVRPAATPSTVAEEKLILAVADNPVIYDLKVYPDQYWESARFLTTVLSEPF